MSGPTPCELTGAPAEDCRIDRVEWLGGTTAIHFSCGREIEFQWTRATMLDFEVASARIRHDDPNLDTPMMFG